MKLVIFDFDGTLTDVSAHAAKFHDACRAVLVELLGGDGRAVAAAWDEEMAALVGGPPHAGLVFGGHVVAPARADPYLAASWVAHKIISRFFPSTDDPVALARLGYQVFRISYARAPAPLRPEARDVLDTLAARGQRTCVVTNTQTDAVSARLDGLGLSARASLRVFGDAQKFAIVAPPVADPRFDALPESMTVPDLPRPILLRRGRYFETLMRACDAAEATPEEVILCGDVFELDLALPAALGSRVHLVTHTLTLDHERAAAAAHPRGGTGADLTTLLARLG